MTRHARRSKAHIVLATFAVAIATTIAFTGPASADQRGDGHHGSHDVCDNTTLGTGDYNRLTVIGNCQLTGTVRIKGGLTLEEGSTLNAFQPNVYVHGDIRVEPGATLGLGCSAAMVQDPYLGSLCPDGVSQVIVNGDLVAHAPLTMDLDGVVVRGDVVSTGGGPGPVTDQSSPYFNFAFKDNIVHGDVRITGWNGGWIGMIRNQVSGSVRYSHNTGTDPDANEIVANDVGGNLACRNNTVPAQFGDAGTVFPYAWNVVQGKAKGECAALVQ
jgi:hypothetical protein